MREQVDEREVREIGCRIKMFCSMRKMKYQDLAERADISPAALYKLFSGRANPRLSTLQLIAEALEVSLGSLVSGQEGEPVSGISVEELSARLPGLSESQRRLLKMYLDAL